MKQINSNTLLELLQTDVREILLQCSALQAKPASLLQQQPQPDKWSVAQVLEHLNFYSRFYITAIEQKLHLNQSGPNRDFTPGWLGNYFTKLMKPRAEKAIASKMNLREVEIPKSRTFSALNFQVFCNRYYLFKIPYFAKTMFFEKFENLIRF